MNTEEESVSFWLNRIDVLQKEREGTKKALKAVADTKPTDEAALRKLMRDYKEVRLSLIEAKVEMLLLITVKACSKIAADKEK